MIYDSLHYCTQELDRYLKFRFSVAETKAVVGKIVDESGSIPAENQNKIILSLVNLEPETNRPYTSVQRPEGAQDIQQRQPYSFNMHVLVSALFEDYGEALKMLSEAVYFFQAKQEFTHENSPGLNPAIQRLTFEFMKVEYSEMHNIWASLGARYLPSALFKVRMLSFKGGEIDGIQVHSRIDEQIKPL